MKNQNSILMGWLVLLFSILPLVLNGQERPSPDEIGFVRLVNLVAVGEGNTSVVIDGKNRWPKGFKLGQRTGGMSMRKGGHEIVISKVGCKGAKKDIEVVAGKTQTLVFYAEPIRDDLGDIVDWELKLARLSQHTPEKGMFMTLISFCEASKVPLVIEETIGETKMEAIAKRLEAVRLEFPEGEVVADISFAEEKITTLATDKTGNYVVMIYEDAQGKKGAVKFFDPKFVLAD